MNLRMFSLALIAAGMSFAAHADPLAGLDGLTPAIYGNGKHRIIVVSAIDCPYCRHLADNMSKLKNLNATVYTVPMVLNPYDEVSKQKLADILCSTDISAAFDAALHRQPIPAGRVSPCKLNADQVIDAVYAHPLPYPTVYVDGGKPNLRMAGMDLDALAVALKAGQ